MLSDTGSERYFDCAPGDGPSALTHLLRKVFVLSQHLSGFFD